MFANLFQLISGRPASPELERRAFIEEIRVQHPEPINPRVERFILICWLLITVKHVFIIWVCRHYPVPFHPLWVNFPTWLLGVLATGLYYGKMWMQARKSS